MHPILIEIYGRQIGTYGVFLILSAIAAWVMVRLLAGKKDKDVPLVFLMCICGGLVGSFLLRPITRIPEIIMRWDYYRHVSVEAFFRFVFGDIVFYGGLIGGVIAMVLFCRGFKIKMLPIADLFAPALALAHGIGRIGCFFGGCCYGVPVSGSHPFAVIFPPESMGAPAGVPILATQLIEAACLFVLSAILVIIYKKTAGKGLAVCIYGSLYSILRFVLEFYRGDMERGIYGIFSTSQHISVALFIVSIVFISFIISRWKASSE